MHTDTGQLHFRMINRILHTFSGVQAHHQRSCALDSASAFWVVGCGSQCSPQRRSTVSTRVAVEPARLRYWSVDPRLPHSGILNLFGGLLLYSFTLGHSHSLDGLFQHMRHWRIDSPLMHWFALGHSHSLDGLFWRLRRNLNFLGGSLLHSITRDQQSLPEIEADPQLVRRSTVALVHAGPASPHRLPIQRLRYVPVQPGTTIRVCGDAFHL